MKNYWISEAKNWGVNFTNTKDGLPTIAVERLQMGDVLPTFEHSQTRTLLTIADMLFNGHLNDQQMSRLVDALFGDKGSLA